MKSLFILLGIVFALGLGKRCDRDEVCPDDVICSMVFQSITVDILDQEGKSAALSRATVGSSEFGATINSLEISPAGGPYTIVNDSHMKWLSPSTPREVEFKGWIGDSLVVRQTFLIRHDCCHVVLVEGPEEIQLN